MLENIWRGLILNYRFIIAHSIQTTVFLLLILVLSILFLLIKLRNQQQQSYSKLNEQQKIMDTIQHRISRLHESHHSSRDKQRLISKQLLKVDDSIFELEDRVTRLVDTLKKNEIPIV